MKKLLMIALLSLLTVNMNCGGGGSGSDSGISTGISGKTVLTINLGETRDTSYSKRGIVSTSSIPPHIVSVRITISAPDMPTIQEVISTVGLTAVTVTMEVPNGPNRHIVVEALNDTGGVLYRGQAYVDLDGTPVSVPITMVSADPLPPMFAGLSDISSITATSMVLSWLPATDNVTPQRKIQYLIYMALSSGEFNFSSPSFTTSLGVTSYTVTGLSPDTSYKYIVWAMDEIGNVDSNMVQMEAMTLSPPDTTPPTFGGVETATALSSTEIELQWSEATDDVTASSSIVYLVYMATTSGGQNFATPSATTDPGVTAYTVTGLTPDTTYYFVVRARDEAGNKDDNMAERSATTPSTPDPTPPTFGGVETATALSATEVELQWSEATDNITPSSNITYLIYIATLSGGQNFAAPSATTAPGVTTHTVTGLSPSTAYYFVVRARDEDGNSDTNTVERSATTLAASDTTPPTFGGLETATELSATEIELQWSEATDNVTASSNITYLIYMATLSGDQNFVSPSSSVIGVTSTTISGLTPCTPYYFVVRARDEALNTETNTVERSATTLCLGWARTFGETLTDWAWSTQQTSDGGYIVAGYTDSFGAGNDDFWVIKLDSTGTIQWEKTFGGTAWDEAYSVQQTSDGGYIIAGPTESFGAGSRDGWVIKLDSTGSIQWQRTYGGTVWDVANSVRQTSDGGYIVAGRTNSFGAGDFDFWVIKLDSTGTIQWQRTYGDLNVDEPFSVQQTSDGGYIVAGRTDSFGAGSLDMWIIKLDNTGTIQWERTYGGTAWDAAYSIQQTSDGGYIVAGRTDSFGAGSLDMWIIKLDSTGAIQWQKTYGNTTWDEAYSVQQTSDGGYVVAGYGTANADSWVIKLDSTGTIQWQRTYGGGLTEETFSVQQTFDGGYIVAGRTDSFGAGNDDFWVLKLLNDGTLGCGLGAGTTATVTNTAVSGAVTAATVTTPTPTVTTTAVTGQNTSATVNTQCSGGDFIDLQPTSATIVGLPGINYAVTNNGTLNANNVTVWVEYGDGCSTFCSPRIISVPAGLTTGDIVPTSPITPTYYTIVVDPNNTVSESDESNNCLDSGSGGCSFPPIACP